MPRINSCQLRTCEEETLARERGFLYSLPNYVVVQYSIL